ncbi:MAG: rhomboid family intramembrane serine protease, partial [bacterium]|nr:rhomboid family intramembrane serine protease [bacterium]
MIFPIGHEEGSVRRLPWVSFTILASCLVAFLLTDTSQIDAAPTSESLMNEAAQYWRDHAYLEPPPEIRDHVSYDVSPNQRRQYLEILESNALEFYPDTREQLAAQKAEFERLVDLALGNTRPEGLGDGGDPYSRWGVTPDDMRVVTLFSHMFLHLGWLHLISNLFIFFLAGPPVEDRLGRPLFAALYCGAGVFAALFWSALSLQKNIPMVGASGAIAGMLGAFLVLYWKSEIRFAYFFMFGFRPIFGTFKAQAWVMLPLWFGNEIFQAWLMDSLGFPGGVAYWAHVGGFVFGAGSLLAIKLLKVEQRFIHSNIEAKITVAEANPLVEEAMLLREQGDDEGALTLLQRAWRENREDRDLALALWDSSRVAGRPDEGIEPARELVRIASGDEDKTVAIQHWMDLMAGSPSVLVAPAALMRFVPVFLRDGNDSLAIQALRHATDPGNEGLTTGLAMKALELARELDPPSALRAAQIAVTSPDLHDVKRERLQGTIDQLIAAGVEPAPAVEQAVREQQQYEPDLSIDLSEDSSSLDLNSRHAHVAPALDSAVPAPQQSREGAGATPPPLALSSDGGLVDPQDEGVANANASAVGPGGEQREGAMGELDEFDFGDLAVAGVIPRFSETKVVEAVPIALGDQALQLRVAPERKVSIEYQKIEAIAVAAVRGLGPKPVLLIDLLLNWTSMDDEGPLRVVRLKSTDFDPRSLVQGVE